MLKYKGYTGYVEYDDEAKLFHGEVLDTKDVITFQGRSVDEIENSFRESIEDYLDFCAQRNEKPDRPFSGKFIIRMNPKLHHRIYIKAIKEGVSINKWVIDTLEKAN